MLKTWHGLLDLRCPRGGIVGRIAAGARPRDARRARAAARPRGFVVVEGHPPGLPGPRPNALLAPLRDLGPEIDTFARAAAFGGISEGCTMALGPRRCPTAVATSWSPPGWTKTDHRPARGADRGQGTPPSPFVSFELRHLERCPGAVQGQRTTARVTGCPARWRCSPWAWRSTPPHANAIVRKKKAGFMEDLQHVLAPYAVGHYANFVGAALRRSRRRSGAERSVGAPAPGEGEVRPPQAAPCGPTNLARLID